MKAQRSALLSLSVSILSGVVMVALGSGCGLFGETTEEGGGNEGGGGGESDQGANNQGAGTPGGCGDGPYKPSPAPNTCSGEAGLGTPNKIVDESEELDAHAGGVTIAAGDLDGDGNVDLATILGTELHLYFGNGDGTVSESVRLTSQEVLNLSGPVTLGDFDGNGSLDVAATGWFGTNDLAFPFVWLNQGGRAFGVGNQDESFNAYDAGGEPIPTGSGGNMIAADLNNDGLSDLLFCGYETRVYLSSCGAIPAGSELGYEGLTVRNCSVVTMPDGDDYPDVILQTYDFTSNANAVVLHGTGTGSFDSAEEFANFSEYAVAADLTNDGLTDLALLVSDGGAAQEGQVGAMIGKPDGSFTLSPTTIDVTSGYAGGEGADVPNIIAADVTNDGNIDLAVMDTSEEGAWSLLRGNGDGSFQPELRLGHLLNSEPVAIFADLNNDGLPDLVAADGTAISVSLNRCL